MNPKKRNKKAELARMGRRSRAKGHAFEREVANLFKRIFPGARRWLENHREDALHGTDIVGTGHFRIQCKKMRKYAPIERITEIECDRQLGDVPVLVTAGDFREPMAVLPLDDLLYLVDQLYGAPAQARNKLA